MMKTTAEKAAPDLDLEVKAVDATIPVSSKERGWKMGRASMLTATCAVAGEARSLAPDGHVRDRATVAKDAGTPSEGRYAGLEQSRFPAGVWLLVLG